VGEQHPRIIDAAVGRLGAVEGALLVGVEQVEVALSAMAASSSRRMPAWSKAGGDGVGGWLKRSCSAMAYRRPSRSSAADPS
jgi:hypothetical protein